MPYGTVTDMIGAFGEVELIRLSAPEGAKLDGIDTARVTTALTNASDLIDSHLRRRYACPLATTPPAINRACLVLARYDLSFGGSTEPSEQARLARKETVEWLGHINAGSVTLEGVEPASTVVYARTSDRGRGGRVGPGPLFQPTGSGLGLGLGFDLW
jgi:phage gp36-like protein